MSQHPRPLTPICPICEKPVEPGDHVLFGHGETIHLNCHFSGGGITESVATFLDRHVDTEYCQSCLARLTQITYEQVVKAVTALRTTSRYRVTAMGTCSVCANRWMTIRAESPAVGGGVRVQPRRILVVGDYEQPVDTLTEYLRSKGYIAARVFTATEALKLIELIVPDVVLMDIATRDAVLTLGSIHGTHRDLPVLVLSPTADVEIAETAWKHGAFDYVAAPFDSGYLLNAIEAAVAYRG